MIKYVFIFLADNELVFLNFYAEWCRFSNLLQPIFDEAADKVNQTKPVSYHRTVD